MLRTALKIASRTQQIASVALLTQAIGPTHHDFLEGAALPQIGKLDLGLSGNADLSVTLAFGSLLALGSRFASVGAAISPIPGPPREGQEPFPGRFLKIRPPDDHSINGLRAVTEDPRFRNASTYHLFEEFLPVGFSILRPPTGQACFASALDIDDEVDVGYFEILRSRLYPHEVSDDFQKGDLVVYFAAVDTPFSSHAGILVDAENVRSRFGPRSPEIKHPLRSPAILSLYTEYSKGQLGFFRVYRKDAESAASE